MDHPHRTAPQWLDDSKDLPRAAEGPGFCRLPDWGLLKISGEDAAVFLQGQATCDIHALTPGAAGCGAFCTHKGRVIANFRIARGMDGFYLLTAAELLEAVSQRLSMFVLRSRVTLEPRIAGEGMLLGLLGTGTGKALESAGLTTGADAPHGWRDFPGGGVLMLGDGTERSILILDAGKSPLLGDLSQHLTPLHPDAWRLRDIEAGFPMVVSATSEEFLPQMLNLDMLGGIGFKKGCYTGQEIVTRTHYLGQLKRRLYRFHGHVGTVPAPGTPVYDTGDAEPQAVGQIVNACREPSGKIQGLAVLPLDHAESPALRIREAHGTVLGEPLRLYPPPTLNTDGSPL